MALRIGGAPLQPQGLPMEQTEAMSDPAMMSEAPMDIQPDLATEAIGGGTVSPELVHYVGPERMDQACQRCIHFMEPKSCEIVAGPIDPAGTCNLFTQDSGEEEPIVEPDMSDIPVEDIAAL